MITTSFFLVYLEKHTTADCENLVQFLDKKPPSDLCRPPYCINIIILWALYFIS